jgi:hypothetical protein
MYLAFSGEPFRPVALHGAAGPRRGDRSQEPPDRTRT